LVGAVHRGASKTAGIHYELERRVEQELNGVDVRAPEYLRGERAGETSGYISRPMATTEPTAERELWGGETAKPVENFPVSGERVPRSVVHWLGRIKAAAARTNAELGETEPDLAERIAAAGDEVA